MLAAGTMPCAGLELDESPAQPGDWGYRPQDGAQAELSPPSFTWRPSDQATAYTLQIAQDESFQQIAYAAERIPWNAHCPSEILPAGAYFWRYAAHDSEGAQSNWSRVRSFTVPEGVPAFPQPRLEQLAARLPAQHPKLFFRPEDVPRLQLASQKALADRWTDLLGQADKLLAEPPDTSEPPKYPKDIEYKSGEWKKIWWGNRIQSISVAHGAATLAFVYRLSGDEKYGLGARDLLMALTAWDPKGSTNYQYNDEAAMPLLYYPARAYTWAYDILTPEERKAVQDMMRARGEDCYNHLRKGNHLWQPYKSHSNRAWHKLGELAVAFQGDFPEAATWLDFSMTIFFTAYPVWGGQDGGWHEGVAYWNSYIGRFMNWAKVMQSGFNIDPFTKPYFKAAGWYALYTLPPGTEAGAWGDQAPHLSSKGLAPLAALLAAGAQNPHWQWYAQELVGELPADYVGFLFAAGTENLESTAPAELPTSRAFRGVGVAALNTTLLDGTENVQLHFKSSPFGRQSHGYNANNAFLLYLHGKPVFIRSGRRDVHGSPHHVKWMWQTKSDNAILVNGEGQIVHDVNAVGEITHFETSDTLDVVVGEAGGSYDPALLKRWTRRIFFLKPQVIVIHDLLEAPEPSTFQWLLHAPSTFTLEDQAVSWSGDAGQVKVRFLHPAGLVLSQTNEFDPPPAEWTKWNLEEWHLTAATEEKAVRQQFITILELDGVETAPQVAAEEDGYRVVLQAPEVGEVTLRLGWKEYAMDRPKPGETAASEN
jgi:hypothetical protein